MPYETGVSTSPSDLLAKMVTRMSTDGWTTVRLTGAPGTQVSMSDGSAAVTTQFNFLADNSTSIANISCMPSNGDSGSGVNFYAHTGSPNTSGTDGTFIHFGQKLSTADEGFSGNSTAYHFFTGTTTSGRYVHVVLEGTAGVFWHLCFGTIEKAGAFDGGAYMTASSVRSQTDGVHWAFDWAKTTFVNTHWFRNDSHYITKSTTTDAGASRWFENFSFAGNRTTTQHMPGPLYQGGLQSFNQRTPFAPIWIHTFDSAAPTPTSTGWVIAGHIPDMRFVSMDGREPGETIVIGADTWHLFPMHRKTTDGTSTTSVAYTNTHTTGGPAPHNDSNLMGLAYRVVV